MALLFDVVERLERSIQARDCPAIIAIEGERRLILSDYDYLRDDEAAAAFEHRVAEQARQVSAFRWVAAVPQVWVMGEHEVSARAVSHHPLRPGEQEAITWMAFDRDDGIDYGRVPYTRRPNGEPVFGDPEVFTIAVIPDERMPGYTLLRLLMTDGHEPTNDI